MHILSRKKLLSKKIYIDKEVTFKLSVYITSSSVAYIQIKFLLYSSIYEITFKLNWHT